ncbi:hypothetical protein [Catenulispora rubra]|uniref:hypothetical protein n=1 Tax=Catenulispora rubra TaxID=280293 RepID=UPI0018920378|nr:hypothetical protein [Catenulispora rubra]
MTQTLPARPNPAAEPPASDRAARRRALTHLSRFEAARLIRHPGTVLALVVLLVVLCAITDTRTVHFPVLQDADQLAQMPVALLLGGTALIQSNLAVLRSHRHGTAGTLDVLVLPTRWRTAAHLLALVPLAMVTALIVAVHIVYLATRTGAVGTVSLDELATGPVVVLLFGAVGVLLGRVTRSVVVGPLLMVVLTAVALLTVSLIAPSSRKPDWFLPFTASSGGDPLYGTVSLPVNLMTRPTGRHLVYLLGLLALITTAALMRGERRRGLLVAGAVGLAVTVAAGVAQTLPPDASIVAARSAATTRPSSQQRCQRIENVAYCTFPGFSPWVTDWNTVVRGVLRRVPDQLAAQPLAVRQRIIAPNASSQNTGSGVAPPVPVAQWHADDVAADTPDALTAGTWWGDGWSETGLAGRVAYEVISRSGPGVSGELCQSRGVLVGWLAAQATAGTKAGLRAMADGSGGGVAFTEAGFGGGLYLPARELAMVWTLLDQPADKVGGLVLQHWDKLSARTTTIEQAAALLGVPAPPAQGSDGEQQCL